MKNILKLFTVALVSLSLLGCNEFEPGKQYEDTNLVHFVQKKAVNAEIPIGTGNKDVRVEFGTIVPVSSTHMVKMVIDPTSTAVQGVHYDIVKDTDEMTPGEYKGEFIIRVLESGMTPSSVSLKIKLEAPTITTASFSELYTLNMSLYCSPEHFLDAGDFTNTGWWMGPGGTNVKIEKHPSESNTLIIKDYFEPGYDFVIKYDTSYNVTFEDQNTGYYDSTNGGFIHARPSVSTAADHGPSIINFCDRKLDMVINFHIPGVGSYGNKVEKFQGL